MNFSIASLVPRSASPTGRRTALPAQPATFVRRDRSATTAPLHAADDGSAVAGPAGGAIDEAARIDDMRKAVLRLDRAGSALRPDPRLDGSSQLLRHIVDRLDGSRAGRAPVPVPAHYLPAGRTRSLSTHLPLQDALRLVVDADPASPTMVADASSLLKTGLYVLTGDLSGMAQTPMASHVAPTRPAVPTVVPAAGSTPAGALATQAPARLPFGMASILAAPAAPSRPSRPLAGARVVPGDASRLSMQRFRQAGLSLVALASGRSSMPDAQAPSTTGLKRKRDPMPAGVDAATGTAATADAAVPTDARKAIDLLRSGGFIVPDDFTLQIPPTADRGSIEAKMRRANTKAVYALQTGRTVYAREKQKLLEAVNREYPTHPFLVSDDSRRAAQGMGI